ncbi:unnamed protein product [Phyllotreta striolata]|uniref:Transcriptional regulator ATRX n=1 Tax=Phyllotreta striolata TaxID=444603 RepID=A0A9N9XP48_PHYSR|nr:unnamed protein product [Phyllotreta striolata]
MAKEVSSFEDLDKKLVDILEDIVKLHDETSDFLEPLRLEPNQNLKTIGIPLAKLLCFLKGNVSVFVKNLHKHVHSCEVDSSISAESNGLLGNMQSILSKCIGNVLISKEGEEGKYTYAKQVDASTMTSHMETDKSINCLHLKKMNISDSAETTDSQWKDTLQRSANNGITYNAPSTEIIEQMASIFNEDTKKDQNSKEGKSDSLSVYSLMTEKNESDVEELTNISCKKNNIGNDSQELDFASTDSDETDIDKSISKNCQSPQQSKEVKVCLNRLESQSSSTSFEFDIRCATESQTPLKPSQIICQAELNDLNKLLDTCLNKPSDLLDCTMEEYLNTQENSVNEGAPQATQEYLPTIKVEKEESQDENDTDLEENKSNETNLSETSALINTVKKLESDSETDEATKAEKILKFYEEHSELSSSLSDSESDTISCDSSMPSETENDVLLKNNKMETDCFVELERINVPPKILNKYNKSLSDNIDWLCNIDNIEAKKPTSPSKRVRAKQRRRVSFMKVSSSSDATSSDDETSDRTVSPLLNDSVRKKLDDVIASTLCQNLKESSSYDSDSSVEDKKNKTDKKRLVKDKPRELTEEEKRKKAWKNDPLLRGNFSDSDSDASCNKKTTKKTKSTSDDDSSFSVKSDDLKCNSDSDSNDFQEKPKFKQKQSPISPVKQNTRMDSDSSDSDSDVQFVSPKRNNSNEASKNSDASPQKGRREIRSILSDGDLAKETKEAKKAEMDRIERLKIRNKNLDMLSQSFCSQSSELEILPLVLDIDEKTDKTVQVNEVLTKKLKPHQREGIKFMWDVCYESLETLKENSGSGCILAHCMGLGKTFQVLSLCHTLFACEETSTKHILIVCPLSTVNNWRKETKFAFEGVQLNFRFFTISGNKCKKMEDRCNIVKKWYLDRRSILVMGYECFENLTNDTKLDKFSDKWKGLMLEYLCDPGPDLVVCDEGHLIKNKKALRTVALHKIRTRRRIVLTGTPLQNNLEEYFEMVSFVKPNLLGNRKEFKRNFVNPIKNGQYEDSNEHDIRIMKKMTHVLHKLLVSTVQRVEDTELEIYLPRMVDYAVYVQLKQPQVDLYNSYLDGTGYMKKEFLKDFITLQLICTHPQLLEFNSIRRKKKIREKDVITKEDDQFVGNNDKWWKGKLPESASQKIEYGSKLLVLKAIIEECEAVGDKLLVFSQNLSELDLIEHFLKKLGTEKSKTWTKDIDYFRMDGTVTPEQRSYICDSFNDKHRKSVKLLLMSTKVGGLGLNLTAANRIVIMTVAWNPSYDTQSVFRAYRFGQKKKVYVYRLIALDTMESKVYQLQVTKLAIAHRVIDKHHITRHYKSHDLELFYSKLDIDSERPTPNVPEDEILANVICQLPCVYKYHEHKALLADRPEDKLSEQELATAWEDFKNNKNVFEPANMELPLHTPGATFGWSYNLDTGPANPYQSDAQPSTSSAMHVPSVNNNQMSATHTLSPGIYPNSRSNQIPAGGMLNRILNNARGDEMVNSVQPRPGIAVENFVNGAKRTLFGKHKNDESKRMRLVDGNAKQRLRYDENQIEKIDLVEDDPVTDNEDVIMLN